ncbi:dolichyl-phosphate-mannose-protein mannosyltransferase [Arcicella aurantiaca]|uniref:Dolichyl-phosphate-mannose-protein mannosyltransferase n=1 Tax=Arcicella aurantiaca TaxID=591202 RepID=A0A316EAI7_9BACT|nr:glycosyltransferase family 39 protein [Arcicella aurantiaca]PWK26582.1 dolichyl-phosphate-mannose-protein mannosyltransferase [Arcicella aurantiaca]
MVFFYPIIFLIFIGFVIRVAARVCKKSLIDIIITAYVVFCGSVIFTGFVLSEVDKINDRRFWAWGVFIPTFIFYILFAKFFARDRRENFTFFEIIGSRIQLVWNWFGGLSLFLKFVFGGLFLTFGIVEITNLLLIFYTPPNEWDSMTGHLNRLLYYLDHGTMAHFGGTNWNIDTYPKSICTIQIYNYLMSGKIENWFKAIHHSAYLIVGFGAFGIARSLSNNFSAGVFCALAIWLLPNVLMQSVTTETDIVLASYLTCLVYFLFTYREKLWRRYLYLAGMTFGIALGHKITFAFSFPPLFFIILYTVFYEEKWSRVIDIKKPSFNPQKQYEKITDNTSVFWLIFARFKHLFVGLLIGICLFTLPTGYLKNIQVYKHPIGPPTALKHQSVERAGTTKNLIIQGSRNVIRYTIDMVNLDGLRNWDKGENINDLMKKPLIKLEKKTPLRLEETTDFTIIPFTYHKRFEFFNANPSWGIFGFAFILPLIFLVLTGFIRKGIGYYILGIAFLLHFLALSFTAAYDPWKGRYMISTAVYAVPFLSLLFTNWKLESFKFSVQKIYVGLVVFVGALSAILAVYLNERCLPFAAMGRKSAFDTERVAFQTWARPDITPAYQKFNQIVPQNATVAVATINDDYEYPLWGNKLTRKLIVVNPFEKGVQPMPKNAEYLFFAKSVIKPIKGDIRLGTDTTLTNLIVKGEDYYLRKLN